MATVTVAQLVLREVQLEWPEAVVVVLEIGEQLLLAQSPECPSYHDIVITADGSVTLTQRFGEHSPSPIMLVDILRVLLPIDSPRKLWHIVVATGPDAAPYESAEGLVHALQEFDRTPRRAVLLRLHQRVVSLLDTVDEELEP